MDPFRIIEKEAPPPPAAKTATGPANDGDASNTSVSGVNTLTAKAKPMDQEHAPLFNKTVLASLTRKKPDLIAELVATFFANGIRITNAALKARADAFVDKKAGSLKNINDDECIWEILSEPKAPKPAKAGEPKKDKKVKKVTGQDGESSAPPSEMDVPPALSPAIKTGA